MDRWVGVELHQDLHTVNHLHSRKRHGRERTVMNLFDDRRYAEHPESRRLPLEPLQASSRRPAASMAVGLLAALVAFRAVGEVVVAAALAAPATAAPCSSCTWRLCR